MVYHLQHLQVVLVGREDRARVVLVVLVRREGRARVVLVVLVGRLGRARVVLVVLVGRLGRARVVLVARAYPFLHHSNHRLKDPEDRPNHRPSLEVQVEPSQEVQVGYQGHPEVQGYPIQGVLVVLVILTLAEPAA